MSFTQDLAHSWQLWRAPGSVENVNININRNEIGSGSSIPRYKPNLYSYDSSSLSKTVFNRIATDAAMVPLSHSRVESTNQTHEPIKSGLQDCLSIEANIDQSAFQFMHDAIYSMLDDGIIAIVPIETDVKPNETGAFDIHSMRVGIITQYFPQHVEVQVYNEKSGNPELVVLPKRSVGIVENPFYEIINTANSTLTRLKRKMALLDKMDEEIASGAFNMIIQLPYDTKSSARKQQAQLRRTELENQLHAPENKYGIGYIGATEKVIQLNRPIDNDLQEQVKYLREEFYNQLGMTENIFNGTADESEMNNYYGRAIDPILKTITTEMTRKFLTKTARTQGQIITYNRDIFKLVPVSTIAEIADTFTRNEILTPNEVRSIVGFRSAKDPKADELVNRNIAQVNQIDDVAVEDGYEDIDPAFDMNLIDEERINSN